jgi:hypothetical protein
MLFTFKCEFIKVSVDLQMALAAEKNPAEGQWLRRN